nr:4Fe-4S binding protein [Motiliproteus sediminis]
MPLRRWFALCWMLALLLGPAAPSYAITGEELHPLIQQLFPKATRIEPPLADFPVVPVYQLSELLGYAFQSQDFTDLPGFSGKQIKLLIGIDAKGRFTGVRVLDHHEPVFLHGLGPEPLFDFVNQYQGHSVADQIIIHSGRRGEPGGPVFIDGVTKATVSVIIINDTVLSAALQVARRQLEGFAQPPAAIPKPDLYEPLDWNQLLQRGLVRQWSLAIGNVEEALGRSLDSYPEWQPEDDGPVFTILYYAYLNAPLIGRNLLGDGGFERLQQVLKPGEQALMVLTERGWPHVRDDFKPGTVPERVGLEQNGLSVELRDLNVGTELPLMLDGTPESLAYHLLRIKAQAGFDPASPMDLRLNVTLARNHLIQDNAHFVDRYQLPDALFDRVEQAEPGKPQPLWLMLWQQRWPQVTILLLALGLLSAAFVHQHWLTERPRLFYTFRWSFLLFTLFWLGFYAQGQLSVVNIYTLLLNIADGFDITIFLLDPVIFILWVFTFISLFIWGRGLFCGWLCPFGALQEMVGWLALKLRIRQWRISERWHRRLIRLKYPLLAGLVGSAFYSLTLAERLAEVEPFKTSITLVFERSWPFVLYALLLLAAGLFVHKFYCRYLCPLGAGLAVIGRLRRFEWLQRIELCGDPCQLCRRHCGINAIHRDGRIDYDECIQCLECIAILNDDSRCVASLQQRKQQARQGDRIAAVSIESPAAG